MSSKTVVFSRHNWYQFAEEGVTLPDSYGFAAPGKALVPDTVRSFQAYNGFEYLAKWSDPQCIHVSRPMVGAAPGNYNVIQITDECGEVVLKEITYTSATSETDYALDTGEKLYTDQFRFRFSDYDELDGYDHVRLRFIASYGDATKRSFITDPIYLADQHKNTVLVKVVNETNNWDTLWEQLHPVYYYRVPSNGYVLNPNSVYTVSEGQNNELVKLHANSYNTLKYNLGGDVGLSSYQEGVLDLGFDCDKIWIDGIALDKEDNAKLERVNDENSLFKFCSMLFRQAGASDANSFPQKQIVLWERLGYPYVIAGFKMTSDGEVIEFPTTLFEDADDEDEFMDLLVAGNNQIDFTGVFDETDGVFTYYNGEDENFTSDYRFLSDLAFILTVQASTVGNLLMSVGTNGKIVMDWGDTILDFHVGQGAVKFNVSHPYLVEGVKQVRIFMDEYFYSLFIGPQASVIKNIGGEISQFMESLYIRNQDMGGVSEVDLSCLGRAKDSLSYLNLQYNNIQAIATGWSDHTPPSWRNLKLISLHQNSLDITAVNIFWSDFYTKCGWTFGGQIYLQQNPDAVVSGGTLAQMDSISTNYGWIVSHD